MNGVMQGLSISVMGLALTFAALALFILCMVALQRLFRPKSPASADHTPHTAPVAGRPAQNMEDQQIAAAIAIALSRLRSLEICRSGLGDTLEAGRGRWWTQGQLLARTVHARRVERKDRT